MTVDGDSDDEADLNAGEDAESLPLDVEGDAMQRTLVQVTCLGP